MKLAKQCLEPPLAKVIQLPVEQLSIKPTATDDGSIGQLSAAVVQLCQEVDRAAVPLRPFRSSCASQLLLELELPSTVSAGMTAFSKSST